MNIEKIHNAFVSGRLLLFAVILGFLAFRLYDVMGDWQNPSFWVSTIIQMGIALLLLQFNHIFTVIHGRTLLPAIFYLIFVGCSGSFSFDWRGSVASLCIFLGHFFLLPSYQNPASQLKALNIAFLLTLGSLLWPQLLFFFPIFWYGFHRLYSFNFRVFTASIIGFISIYLFIFTWSVYVDDWNVFFSSLPGIHELIFITQPDFTLSEWIIIGFTLLICALSGFNLFVYGPSEKIRIVSIMGYLHVSSFVIFVLLLLQSEYKSHWGLILFVPVTLLVSHFFTLSNKKFVKYLMLLFVFFFLGMGVWQRFSP
jgi:hypothetical protein